MGVGGKFWDMLKPYSKHEGPDFLRNKRVAVDLSFWIVQHETAIKTHTRNPHIRLTFFRTINLFAKFGAFPVFVVDGIPSPLKSQARIARFFRYSGIDVSSWPVAEEGVYVERNGAFSKCVRECVELLELLGMPVLKAKGEAEALCAQLNSLGHVDACITSDSDAFLFDAKSVIKCLRPNSKEPFECYHISDIETGLGLKRKHLIAISLLVGNDHDLNGVQGIGLDSALRFVQKYSEDEILNRLREVSNANNPLFLGSINSAADSIFNSDESSPKTKSSHCSFCGHPGNKRVHFKFSCDYCGISNTEGCVKKPEGFKCNCSSCDQDRKYKEQRRNEIWQIKVCAKIAIEPNFPNEEIMEMYLCQNHGNFNANEGPCISWGSPDTEMLVDFLAFHQFWQPSYVRQRMLPMLSTIYLREMAASPVKTFLHQQYEFDSIQRVKVRYGIKSYVVKWKKAAIMDSVLYEIPCEKSNVRQEEFMEVDESFDLLDEANVPQIHGENGHWFLLTDENMELLRSAFPEEVDRFLQEKELKELKRRKSSVLGSEGSNENPESLKSKGVQLIITEFYRSTKLQPLAKPAENLATNSGDGSPKGKRKAASPRLSKSVRRRLLFN
ncbi:XPG_N domain-containing protein/XPG_I domain-containing protein [Cephalotus follicularis]|uniref:Flap endonuclease GEN-like 1 n=1 Tax=Cephalotus follicularis TaxID=3775 RepID=A0A1Q3DHM5_CEPFO|nr:XPG_N domain-containing protein/XPG_I domain-containing protein [Cephalotus follicularis]